MASATTIPVCIRVRPLSAAEVSRGQRECWRVEGNTIAFIPVSTSCSYTFDHIFSTACSTRELFETIARPVVTSALHGFNGNIFAYGQTSSGKTYTMSGSADGQEGVVHLTARAVFGAIEADAQRSYVVHVAYMEIYNEKLADLLSSEQPTTPLTVRQDFSGACYIPGMSQVLATTPEAVVGLLRQGNEARQTAATNLNERSSRSHTIFQLTIERLDPDTLEKVRSTLNLVDLAGSERANQTQAQGRVLNEAKYINKSLLALSNVIKRLSEMKESGQEGYVNFRDSVLTRILQPALGGNSKTAIICTIAPGDFMQSESTLQFASRAKTIKNRAQVNEVQDPQVLLQRYEREVQQLRTKLREREQESEDSRKRFDEEVERRVAAMRADSPTLVAPPPARPPRLSGPLPLFRPPAASPRAGGRRSHDPRRHTWAALSPTQHIAPRGASPAMKRRRLSTTAPVDASHSDSEDLAGDGGAGAEVQLRESCQLLGPLLGCSVDCRRRFQTLQHACEEKQAEVDALNLQLEAVGIANSRQIAETMQAAELQVQENVARNGDLERALAESEESLLYFKNKVQTLEELFETLFQEKQVMREDFKLRRQKDLDKLKERHAAELQQLNERWQARYTALQEKCARARPLSKSSAGAGAAAAAAAAGTQPAGPRPHAVVRTVPLDDRENKPKPRRITERQPLAVRTNLHFGAPM